MGTNLCSMESAGGLRYGASSLPNVNLTVPRREDVAWLAANGYTKTRLPIRWEFLQPMLHDTVANAAAKDAIGSPGAFHPGYESYITGVMDAHAAAGIKCIIDCHNYCRYQDFVFQADGSVIGLVKPSNPLIHAYTTDNTQVQTRIFALAPGTTLKQSNYIDFFSRVAAKWKDHPGFGGYGLMNEPFFLPKTGDIVESFQGFGQDLTIWPTYAKAVIAAIRGLDPVNPIYVAGNNFSGAWSVGTDNPGWPINAPNLIYELHMYLDAFSNGTGFDFDLESLRDFSAGVGEVPISADTGVLRLKPAVDWASANGTRLAVMETGMPLDDVRWQESWTRFLNFARQSGVEVYSWGGGNHWDFHNHTITHVPGWHQNKTLEPPMSGPMKAAAGVALATLFDDGPGWAPDGTAVTITVYARGNLANPVTLTVSSNNGGTLSKSTLSIPAGPNGQDTFTYTSASNRVATLTYASSNAPNVPPPRKIYSLSDPVAYAATSLTDAAMALIAKYAACKWELADGYTDYMQGVPAGAGQVVRAISDSGYGSSPGNAMEMINWTNTEGGSAMGTMVPPVMRVTNGKKNSDHSAFDTHGFWCRKSLAVAGLTPKARNLVPYNIADPHFAIAAVSVPGVANNGVVFQASNAVGAFASELGFSNSQPAARWVDSTGTSQVLVSPTRLAANAPAVISFTSSGLAQQLRVNSAVAASGAVTLHSNQFGFDQFLLGWGFLNFFPRDGFGGNIYSAITGKGTPTADEMQVMERYVGSTAGI
ncbi:MAG TPA: cellulase family glycosylhydrolase [Ramlibacter sp.]|nr:cellulase family glycosylhydrolase [Ramlibacter sp.]